MKTKELRSGSGRASRSSYPDTGRSEQGGSSPDERPMTQVGRYLLLKKLGEGGMGVVYSAYDPDLDRKVALKLLHSDGRADAEVARARLQREAQAMARISHPNVIPIFDVGIWGAQVFMAMEMVDGGTLASWMKEKPRTWREVLEKFMDAGRGLQAAHAAGLVHRDFKPANVLMSHEGRVSVTDFGLAVQLEGGGREEDFLPEEAHALVSGDNRMLEANITRKGLVMGTPNYMSPEQFRGADLDARSDQFSFCVALYWCLYGKRAFEPARMREFSSQKSRERELRDSLGTQSVPSRSEATSPMRVRPTAPIAPGSRPRPVVEAESEARVIQEPPRDAKVPTWVRNALMRGLELEAGARFPSMAALLDALSQEQRLLKRRRWVTGLSAAAVGAMVVGAGVYQSTQVCARAAVGMDGVWNDSARGRLEASFAATQLPFAGEVATRVTQTLGDYAAAWRTQSIEACEATRRNGSQSEELFTRRVACLDRRRQDLNALVTRLGEGVEVKAVSKAIDAAHSLPALSECADAAALAEQQSLPEDATKRAEVVRLAEQVSDVKALLSTGRIKEMADKTPALEPAVVATGHLPLMAELRYLLGVLHIQREEKPEAARLLAQSAYDAEAGRADRLLAKSLVRLVYAEGRQKHFDQSESWASFADATLRRIGGEQESAADLLANRSVNLSVQRRFPEALQLLKEAQALRERVLPPGHPKLAQSSYSLGFLLMDMGQLEESERLLQQALVQTREALGPKHPDMILRHNLLSDVLRQLGRGEQAVEHAHAASTLSAELFGEGVKLASGLDFEAMALSSAGRHAEALAVYQRALALKRKKLPPDDPALSYSLDGVGQELLKLGRPQEAIEPLRQSVTFADLDPDTLAESNFALAKALLQTGASAEARTVASLSRKQFEEAKLAPRVGEVDAWLDSLPITHQVVQVRHKRRGRH